MKDLDIDYGIKTCIEKETEALGGERPASENIIVTLYELGRIARSWIYSGMGGNLPAEDENLYAAEMCIELADVITQSLILFHKLRGLTNGWKDTCSHELIYSGIERQQERMKEVLDKTIVRNFS